MKDKEMRKAYDKAIRQWVKADSALQVFASHIVFRGLVGSCRLLAMYPRVVSV